MKKFFGIVLLVIGVISTIYSFMLVERASNYKEVSDAFFGLGSSEVSDLKAQAAIFIILAVVFLIIGIILIVTKSKAQIKKEVELELLKKNQNQIKVNNDGK